MHKNNSSLSSVSLRSVLLVLSFVLAAGPAHAGFQWVSPPASGQDTVAMPAPVPSAPAGSAATSFPDSFPQAQIIEGKPALAPIRSMPAPASQPAVSSAPKNVQGFADKVPLSVALHQILPEGTGYSVAQDVNLSSLVSWKGGAPWQQVMADMLAPSNLTFNEQDGLVRIIHAQASAPLASTGSAIRPAADLGAPVALLPSANELPVRSIPDRNMPNGVGGLLNKSAATPASSSAPAPAPIHSLAPMPPMSLGAPTSLSSAPAVTETAPYVLDKAVSAWNASKGETLQSVLSEWCKRANVELSWQAEYDYPLQASVSLSGAFEGAVRGLLAGFQDADPQPVGYLYNNQVAGQTVLVVQVRGNSYNE